MATFNSMPALSSATSDAMGLNMGGPGQSLAMEGFDQDTLPFDEFPLDPINGALPQLPFTPSYDFENFNTFEDPFSYSARQYEAPPPPPDNDAFNDEESPQELDNKLLGFSAPIQKATVVDETGQFAELGMAAELHGMFFVAEDVFGAENTGRPLELTCYRRNLWQCAGQITLPRHVTHVINEQGRQVPIFDLAASITAIESIDGKPTEIISIPWKSSNPASDETKVAAPPPNLPLDLSAGQEADATRVSLPVSWKRLQFKHATANNGRRKGLQQHYVVQISLLGKMKSGEFMRIAEIQSGPVIVRGRSPRNFDSSKDVPLMPDKKVERRSTVADTSIKTERDALSQNLQRYHSLGNVQQAGEWTGPQPYAAPSQSQHPAKKMATTSPNPQRPPIPSWGRESTSSKAGTPSSSTPPTTAKGSGRPGTSVPLNLSLSEDERSPNRNSVDAQSPQFSKTSNPGVGPSDNAMEDADLLYEYFPLTVDDWMPPVDAVYRPHVVHHIIVPPDVKAQQIRGKSKRYFIAE